jgi:rare lipoprotein A
LNIYNTNGYQIQNINKNKILLISCVIFILVVISSCSPSVRFTTKINNNDKSNNYSSSKPQLLNNERNVKPLSIYKIRGYASFYSDKFEGNKTACGEIFNQNKFTAAHRELACGTIIKVTNIANEKFVIVKINDRGPFAEGRILDLSKSAAIELDILNKGVVEVEYEIMNNGE